MMDQLEKLVMAQHEIADLRRQLAEARREIIRLEGLFLETEGIAQDGELLPTKENVLEKLRSLQNELAEAQQARAAKKVHVGDSALTRDLVWCECGRGLSLSGRWLYCPTCGAPLDQDSYHSAVTAALEKGAGLYRNPDTLEAEKERDRANELLRRALPYCKTTAGAAYDEALNAAITAHLEPKPVTAGVEGSQQG